MFNSYARNESNAMLNFTCTSPRHLKDTHTPGTPFDEKGESLYLRFGPQVLGWVFLPPALLSKSLGRVQGVGFKMYVDNHETVYRVTVGS